MRRWKAYWITSALGPNWFVFGAVLGQGTKKAEAPKEQMIGLAGLVSLTAGTAVEAGSAMKRAHASDEANHASVLESLCRALKRTHHDHGGTSRRYASLKVAVKFLLGCLSQQLG